MIKQLQSNKFLAIFPLALFLLNLFCKGLYLASPEISHDEPFSIYHAQFNVSTIIDQLKGYNNPPLYEILLHFWIKVFGISASSVRSLPLIFASLSPVALFFLGKKYFSERVGVVSSLLLSCSNLVTYHSHDSRVYTLFLLLSILSMHYFLALITEQLPQLRAKIFFILSSALLIYSHYFGFFVLFIQAVYLLCFYRKAIPRMLVHYGIVALLFLPHVVILFSRFQRSVGGTWLEPPSGIESLYNMIWSFSNAPVVAVFCIVLLVAGLVITLMKRDWNKTAFLVGLWFLVPFFGMFFISFAVPMYISRYLIYSAPAFYLLLTLYIDKIRKNILIHNVIAGVLILGFIISMDLNPVKNTHVTELVAEVKSHRTANTAVVICPFDFIDSFTYNYNRAFFSEVSDQKEYHLTDSLLRNDKVFLTCDVKAAWAETELIYVVMGERSKELTRDTSGIAHAGYKLQGLKQVDDITKVLYYKK